MKQNIKDFESWRAEQLASVFLSRFDNLIINKTYSNDLDFVIGINYQDKRIEELFGIKIFAGKSRSWFTKQIRENKDSYEKYQFPILLFLFEMDYDTGFFTWILKPLSKPTFTDEFIFYKLSDKTMEGLIGFFENWYFEKNDKSFIQRLYETWKKIDNKNLKMHDRIYFSCTEDWEVNALKDKIKEKYPSYSDKEINSAIKQCCNSEHAPFEKLAFENCVEMRLRYKT